MVSNCGFKDDVMVSGDAGRFVCNYVYCYSLDKTSMFNSTHGEEDGLERECKNSEKKRIYPTMHSLFLHVPPFKNKTEERQMEFVAKLMKSIRQQLVK